MKFKTIIKRLLSFIGKSRILLIMSFLAAILSVIANLVAPIIIGTTIDTYLFQPSLSTALQYVLLLAIVYVFYSLFSWIMMLTSNKIAYASSATLRKQLYAKMEKLPIAFFDTHAHGDLMSRYINDIDLISDGLLQGLSTMISGVVTILFCSIIMIKLNLFMSLVVIISAPFTYFIAKTITTRSQIYFHKQATTLGKLNAYSEEMLAQIKSVKAYAYEAKMNDSFQTLNQDLYTSGVKSQFYGSLANPSTRFVTNVAYALVGLAGAIMALRGDITIGSISIFLIYSNVFSKPFNEISGVITQLQSAFASAQRIFTILDMQEEIDDTTLPSLKECNGNIRFDNVSFAYEKNASLMKHLNITIKAGSRVAVVGKTGAGKTTLVNLMMRFYDISDGKIYIDGQSIDEVTRNSLRQQFGMVLQNTYLFEDTIAANIAYGKKTATREEIIQAAKKSGAHEFITRLHDGYDTILHANHTALSQGQRQLLSITRVLLMNPSILILDEATSSIDTRSEQYVNTALELLMQGKTSFIIAHRLSTIVNADMILLMEHGSIIEQGKHEDLLRKKGEYAKLYTSQFS